MNFRKPIKKIDLHMHSTVSDGTKTPLELISTVREAGMDLFSLTDHDAIDGCSVIREHLTEEDPLFISGVEFSCKDVFGKYHILAYGYDRESPAIKAFAAERHSVRIKKAGMRLEALKERFGIDFSRDDVERLYANKNPGKPHIADLLVKYGYAETIKDAINRFLKGLNVPSPAYHPEETIARILEAGGIPVLAHPSYGSGGDELIMGKDMDERLQRLISFGLKGVEAYYSGFSFKMQDELLDFAEKYGLYVTAGSDYHGEHKPNMIGDTNLQNVREAPAGLWAFLEAVPYR